MDALIDAALAALGIDRLVLGVHDASFPSTADEDVARGTPYGRGAEELFRFARGLGFRGVQLGPQGQTSIGNPSPYDASVFSKNVASIALGELATERYGFAVAADDVARVVSGAPAGDDRAHHDYALGSARRLVERAATALLAPGADPAVAARVRAFAERSPWLTHDATFEAFADAHGTEQWHAWPAGDAAPDDARVAEMLALRPEVAFAYALGQLVLHEQHEALRGKLAALGVALYGDLQVGLSLRDRWRRDALFLPRWRMGAPPSRTNRAGQPWGYPLLDPRRMHRRFVGDTPPPGGPYDFLRARLEKVFAEFDGVRVDHPHGLVCPWVYDGEAADPDAAVLAGERVFESPSSPHADLAALAIARAEQIDPSHRPWDDGWVRDLTPAQVDEYACSFDLVVACARAAGRDVGDVACEVLSTCPFPLEQVMRRHGLGRFRVTQKAKPGDPADGYRSEHAEPNDWIMIGNHDTEPLLVVVDRWTRAGELDARAAYLADRLSPSDPSRRAALARSVAEDPRKLVLAMFAELFASRARNVLVFFTDLFGERAIYNRPGVVSAENWSVRVPRAFARVYEERRARGEALDMAGALAAALRAKGSTDDALVRALEARAATLLP